jgi:hypothetical protein
MIEFYRTANSADGDRIEELLKKLVLAHNVIIVKPGNWPVNLPPDTSLPALIDSKKIISGTVNLNNHLDWLGRMAYEWHTYQGDACYIIDDDDTCL